MTIPEGLELDTSALDRLEHFAEELRSMNRRINLVSREDEDAILRRHIPHCLALAVRSFSDRSVVVDWGTGGGLPLIPLAIVFPEVSFVGVDAVGKKIQAVRTFARRLGLDNVDVVHSRAEEVALDARYSVSRATAPLPDLWTWHRRVAVVPQPTSDKVWAHGLVCLKGGELDQEIEALRQLEPDIMIERLPVDSLLNDPYFVEKEIVSAYTRPEDE